MSTAELRRLFVLDAEYHGLTLEEQSAWLVRLSRYHLARSASLSTRSRRMYRVAVAATIGAATGAVTSVVMQLVGGVT